MSKQRVKSGTDQPNWMGFRPEEQSWRVTNLGGTVCVLNVCAKYLLIINSSSFPRNYFTLFLLLLLLLFSVLRDLCWNVALLVQTKVKTLVSTVVHAVAILLYMSKGFLESYWAVCGYVNYFRLNFCRPYLWNILVPVNSQRCTIINQKTFASLSSLKPEVRPAQLPHNCLVTEDMITCSYSFSPQGWKHFFSCSFGLSIIWCV